MPFGEVFLGAFLQVLFERLASRELLQLASQEGVRSKLKKWEAKLKMIEKVLIDAEEKQLTDTHVKTWLDDLRDLAYDIEDVLDEFATEVLKRKVMADGESSSSCGARSLIRLPACFSGLSPSAIKLNLSMGSKIREISSQLEELCKLRTDLRLEEIAGRTSDSAIIRQRTATTCLQNEPAVYGRDEDRAKILEMMLKNESIHANFVVIPIVGMGGVGKTTLAREVYNYKAVEVFNPKAWVCVSDDFDVLRISKAIFESITGISCNLKDLNSVQLKLKEVVSEKKFLVVLDDVWSESYELWQVLKSPFMSGAPGSRIIVTTRSVGVALTMGPGKYYDLNHLSDDDCWSVFVQHAFEGRDTDTHQYSESIRQKVIENCKGLPLSARVLGGLLRSKQRDEEWEHILKSKIWDLPNQSEIPAALKLSYHHLPSPLKRCFIYCAIFPKDYQFSEKELVLLWMAEGLIQESKGNKHLEDFGSEYFNELVSRSIFLQSSDDKSKYIMHDLVNDLAQWASGEFSFKLEDELGVNKPVQRFVKARHSSYVCYYLGDGKHKFDVFQEVEKLRTFLPILMHGGHARNITYTVFCDILPRLKKLRVLSLVPYYIPELPNSIGILKHLRFLNLGNTWIRILPESTCSLYNLQILILRDCFHLKKLPSRLGNLINLRHLDIRGVNLLKEMPSGMRRLKHLRTLTNFIVGRGTGSSLEDLKSLKFLRGELNISRLENAADLQDTGEAMLNDIKDIEVLILQWGSLFDESRNAAREKNILDMLQPHKNLKELTVKCYGGIEFPSWMGNPLFNMVVLKLEGCKKCTSLPSLGLLGSLKQLIIQGMPGLRSIGSEIYGDGCQQPFQSLETLHFVNLQEWEHWLSNGQAERFPCLHELSIVNCPKLSGRLPDHLPLLKKLMIRQCAQLVISFTSLPILYELEIDGCKSMVWSSLAGSNSLKSMTFSEISNFIKWLTSQRFQEVEHLKIGCEELIHMWQLNEIRLEKSLEGLHGFTSLRQLCIENCSSLTSCMETRFLPKLSKLQVINCSGLMFIVKGQLPSSLESLHISKCKKLQCVVDDSEDISSSSSSSRMHNENIVNGSTSILNHLYISYCASLTCLFSSGQLPSSLKELDLRRCEKLQWLFDERDHTFASFSSSFSSVMQKESFNNTNNTSLLEHVYIYYCPSLTCLSLRGQLPAVKHIHIWDCQNLMMLSSRGQLPEALETLRIEDCPKFQFIAERFYNNASLRYIHIKSCDIKFLPEDLHNLIHLQQIYVWDCPSLISLPEGGIPSSNLLISIADCEKLNALPDCMHSLRTLQIHHCPSIIFSPVKSFSTNNLTSLTIEGLNTYKPFIQWGLQKLKSLSHLSISGCPDTVVSFPEEGMMLPSSLTFLGIQQFQRLKYLSSRGFQNLTSLEALWLFNCPQLMSFPEAGLPSSLVSLDISKCPLLKKQCKRNKGMEWSKIAHIPGAYIDCKYIYDPEEEEGD